MNFAFGAFGWFLLILMLGHTTASLAAWQGCGARLWICPAAVQWAWAFCSVNLWSFTSLHNEISDKLAGSHMQILQPQEQTWHLLQLCVHSSPGSPFCALSWWSARSCFYFEPQLIELLFAGFWLCFSMLPEKELREQTAFLSYCYCLEQVQTAWLPHAAILRTGQGEFWHLLLAGRIRLSWLGKDTRKILIGISDVTREGRGLSLPQEKGCKLCFLLRLLKGISIQIFCDLFPWEFCIEIGKRNNEREESDSVELVGKYYCSCFSWSFRSQSLKERQELLVVPGLSCGSESLYALSQVIYCCVCISGASVSQPLCKVLPLS